MQNENHKMQNEKCKTKTQNAKQKHKMQNEKCKTKTQNAKCKDGLFFLSFRKVGQKRKQM